MPASPDLSTLPLFPLGTVLFPGGVLPLRIFEVRYLDLIGRCQRSGEPFGVVTLTAGSEVRQPGHVETFCDVGTLATIEAFSNPQPGLMLIHCRGTQRFRIHTREQLQHGLWTARAERIAQDARVAVPSHLASAADALRALMAALREQAETGDTVAEPTVHELADCGWVANRWAEMLPLTLATKHNLMALENPLLRLELVSDLLPQHGIGATPDDGP